jgi:hypothetical protein
MSAICRLRLATARHTGHLTGLVRHLPNGVRLLPDIAGHLPEVFGTCLASPAAAGHCSAPCRTLFGTCRLLFGTWRLLFGI